MKQLCPWSTRQYRIVIPMKGKTDEVRTITLALYWKIPIFQIATHRGGTQAEDGEYW